MIKSKLATSAKTSTDFDTVSDYVTRHYINEKSNEFGLDGSVKACAVAPLTAAELREPQIKAAVIDELFASGRIDDDTVIISEMPVAAFPRRADLVVANGSLLGFEIKSDGDKTSRLRGQIEAYRTAFEGLIIVTGAKHLDEVLSCAPATVGIFVIDAMENDAPKARLVRKPHIRKMDIDTAIRQMRASDLYRLARSHGVATPGEKDRFTLEQRVRSLPAIAVRQAALQAIKCRYRKQFEDFRSAKADNIQTVEALRFLRRPAWKEVKIVTPREAFPVDDTETANDLGTLKLAVRPRRVS